MPGTQHCQRPSLLGLWRKRFQWLLSLTVLLLPWIQPGGTSLVRIDIPSLSLHFFGQVLRIAELYLLLLLILVIAIAFLLITVVLGRVWCGWACPQTILSDLAEWLAGRFGLKVIANRLVGSSLRKTLTHIVYGLLALLVSASLIWYFIEPQRFLVALLQGSLPGGVLISFLVIATIIYLDLALIRRLMCREFCPYGRIQSSFVDTATLTLQLPEDEKPRCIKCNSCVHSCPLDIDIRNGYQIECINCGRCLDACRQIMAKRNESGLIHYTFGTENRGPGALLNPRVLILGILLLALISALTYATVSRATASLKISLSPIVANRVVDARQSTLLTVWINNRTNSRQRYRLEAVSTATEPVELRGQTSEIAIAAGGNYQLHLMVLTPVREQSFMVEFRLYNRTSQQVATARARITSVPDSN